MDTRFLALIFASTLSASAFGGVVFQYDFEEADAWPNTATDVMPSTPIPVEPTIVAGAVGTINKANTSDPSGGMSLSAEVGDADGEWTAHFYSGLLPASTTETNLGKLTLSFDLSASIARPIKVVFDSFDANKRRTGGLEAVVYPPRRTSTSGPRLTCRP